MRIMMVSRLTLHNGQKSLDPFTPKLFISGPLIKRKPIRFPETGNYDPSGEYMPVALQMIKPV